MLKRFRTLAQPGELADTVDEVEKLDRRIIATQTDVRDVAAVASAVDAGVAQLGKLDIVAANAGITSYVRAEEMSIESWQTMIDINLTGI